jgi:hypothetical protein
MTTVTVYKLTNKHPLLERENWYLPRKENLTYSSSLHGKDAAEEAYDITNRLTTNTNVDMFHGPSMEVGDVVRVENVVRASGDNQIPEYYMCKTIGWEKYDDNIIDLIKYLL